MIRRLILVIGLAVLAGCGSPPVTTPSQSIPVVEPTTVAPPVPEEVVPEGISIPELGVSSSLIPLGLAADGSHEVPSVEDPGQAGWYEYGPEPGQVGPAIILGHIDGSGQRGIFWDLHTLGRGDVVEISLESGVVLDYEVTEVLRVDKDQFPRDRVYGFTADRELVLITCGGEFGTDRAGHYDDNVLVFASLAE